MRATEKKPAAAQQIHADMRVQDVLTILPDAAPILAQYGLSCFSCSMSGSETLADGCRSHGFRDEEIQDLLTDLCERFTDRPERPKRIAVTEAAAHALKKILDGQEGDEKILRVTLDDAGGFCMECVSKTDADDLIFGHPAVTEVQVAASPLTLMGIGGATIDFRDERFKLDLPEDLAKAPGCGCGGTGDCACKNGGECGCETGKKV